MQCTLLDNYLHNKYILYKSIHECVYLVVRITPASAKIESYFGTNGLVCDKSDRIKVNNDNL